MVSDKIYLKEMERPWDYSEWVAKHLDFKLAGKAQGDEDDGHAAIIEALDSQRLLISRIEGDDANFNESGKM